MCKQIDVKFVTEREREMYGQCVLQISKIMEHPETILDHLLSSRSDNISLLLTTLWFIEQSSRKLNLLCLLIFKPLVENGKSTKL